MIVVVGGIKGGTGKTTIATNLAVCRSVYRTVLLVDADEQRSLTDWADQRELWLKQNNYECEITTINLAGKTVGPQLLKMSANYDDIIVDVGGRDTNSQRSALTVADVCVIPFKPRSLDIWTLGAVKGMIEEIRTVNPKLVCYALLNMADSKGTDNIEATEILKEWEGIICLPQSIGNRKAFGNAATLGIGVIEGPKLLDRKAATEIDKLHYCVFKVCRVPSI